VRAAGSRRRRSLTAPPPPACIRRRVARPRSRVGSRSPSARPRPACS
jgi:hypothetical protein